MPDSMTFTVTLPWPAAGLSSNSRLHWSQKARMTKQHRYWAQVAAQSEKVERIPDATVFVEYYPAAHRMDIQNVPHSLKAYIDGLADAMGCDDKRFKVDYPTVWAGKRIPGEVVFRIAAPTTSVPLRGVVLPDGRVVK